MAQVKRLTIPLRREDIDSLEVGDMISLTGNIIAGRDAVLPKVCELIANGTLGDLGMYFEGGAVFHTAVSPAGVGPTSSNKVEIEGSFDLLASAGIRLHLGKGSISKDTVNVLAERHSCFAVTPPVTALLGAKTISSEVIAFPELGMEALHLLRVDDYPAIIAAVNGESMFDGLGK